MHTITQEQFNALITRIGDNKRILDKDIQDAAIFAIEESLTLDPNDMTKGRNSTPANELFRVCAKSIRREALKAYFEQFGNLAYSALNGGKIVFFDVEQITGKKPGALDAASWRNVMWYDCRKEVLVSDYDIKEAVAAIIKKAKKYAAENDRKVLNPELTAKLEDLIREKAV